MPCLMSQSPAGVQVYLLTSFIFTLFQGAALRNNSFRGIVGLPLKGAPPPEGKFVKEFILYNKLERDTAGVLSPKFQSSFKPYAEVISPEEMKRMEREANKKKEKIQSIEGLGVMAAEYQPAFQPSPIFLIVNQIADSVRIGVEKERNKKKDRIKPDQVVEIAPTEEEIMDASNRGERPMAPLQVISDIKDEKELASLKTKNLRKKRKQGIKSKTRRR